MGEPVFEASKEGVKLSYSRFLSDSAAGLAVVLVAILAYHWPIFGDPFKQAHPVQIGNELKVLIAILLFLLATPLGLMLNATSWFLLGRLQLKLEIFFYRKRLLWTTRQAFGTDHCLQTLGINERNFYQMTEFVDHALQTYFPHLGDPLAHARGVYKMTRTLSMLVFAAIPLSWYLDGFSLRLLVLLVASLALFALSTAADLHRTYFNLVRLDLLMLKHSIEDGGTIRDVLRLLAQREKPVAHAAG